MIMLNASRLVQRRAVLGVSLIELMVGVAIGLALVVFVLRSMSSSIGHANVNSLVSEYQTNGRYALEELKREVRHASLRPMAWVGIGPTYTFVTQKLRAKNFGCGLNAGGSNVNFGGTAATPDGFNAWPGIEVANDTNPYSGTCLQNSSAVQYLHGDVLHLRRTERAPATAINANAPYVRTSYGAVAYFLGGADTPNEFLAPVADYRLMSDIYFINAFTVSANEKPRVPALYRLRLSAGPNPQMQPELVASNVEHFQVMFGQTTPATATTPATVRYVSGQQVTDWSEVTSARIWLLLRATSPEAGFASGSYDLGDLASPYEPEDNFRRTVLTSTISLRNQ
jgi:type IV pilus assembly protein PilW